MQEEILEVSKVPPGHARWIRLSSEIKYSTRLHVATLVSRWWCAITDLNIYDQKKKKKNLDGMKKKKKKIISDPENSERCYTCCRMLLLPQELMLCSDMYQRGCYWILPRTEQEYTSSQWLLRTEWNSTEWAGGAGDPLLQNGDITFLHLWSGGWLKALEGFDDACYGRWLLMWYLDVHHVV